ncbi:MAG: permease prefix domain 1-containing protein [Methanomassiliicoccaceae archaeon]|nr:permease prefix domain 1-containing protein [Methanomassiliicoccaceae archaeon]
MKEKIYVDRLFADYEDTPEIRDFKEEIAGNLKERVKELRSKGLGEEEAFEKATAELGDITAIADDVGKTRRNEAIGQMYMKAKVPITKKTAAGLTFATALLLLGAGLGVINYFSETSDMLLYYISVLLVADAAGTYAYFGLTGETAARYPMKSGRALAYYIIIFVGVLGEGLASVMFFFDGMELSAALGIEFVLVFPAVCALIFMIATETDRKKPWFKAMTKHEAEKEMEFYHNYVDPVKAARFGVSSGGLWFLAAALFVTLFFIFEWQHAWVVFLFAFAAQIFMVATIFGKNNEVRA